MFNAQAKKKEKKKGFLIAETPLVARVFTWIQ